MKIVFVSNYFNHHQSALSDELYKFTDGQYTFIQTEQMSDERKKLGWGVDDLPNYVMTSYSGQSALNECIKQIMEADAVIAGSAPNKLLKDRLKAGKLIFRYSERIYKSKKNIVTLPLRFLKYHTYNYGSKNVYMLCASAYASSDYSKTFNYIGKCYKFGYFPKTVIYSGIGDVIKRKKKNSLLWVARFIDWKHPEIPVFVAKHLKEKGYDFELKMIGNGIMERDIKDLVSKEDLEDRVKFLGSMGPDGVREVMEQSQIFLFTSDRNEGWGAVLNEAMNSGCAVVANEETGSAPYLIEDGKNGYLYKNGNLKDLCDKVVTLLDDKQLAEVYGKNAYISISETWNAEIAAKRLITTAAQILKGNGKKFVFNEGPFSSANQ